ncbi:hypothetical protein [Bifidobacterium mongoliense]|uniref:hypothetical protein n=1 Tax=Bifidobacterium mongoliense TaxID=518643 RepID=UPI0026472C28|nr:hypothetical protein [Bifidobacterium mongoliense]
MHVQSAENGTALTTSPRTSHNTQQTTDNTKDHHDHTEHIDTNDGHAFPYDGYTLPDPRHLGHPGSTERR